MILIIYIIINYLLLLIIIINYYLFILLLYININYYFVYYYYYYFFYYYYLLIIYYIFYIYINYSLVISNFISNFIFRIFFVKHNFVQDLSENHVMWVQFSWLIKIFTKFLLRFSSFDRCKWVDSWVMNVQMRQLIQKRLSFANLKLETLKLKL